MRYGTKRKNSFSIRICTWNEQTFREGIEAPTATLFHPRSDGFDLSFHDKQARPHSDSFYLFFYYSAIWAMQFGSNTV